MFGWLPARMRKRQLPRSGRIKRVGCSVPAISFRRRLPLRRRNIKRHLADIFTKRGADCSSVRRLNVGRTSRIPRNFSSSVFMCDCGLRGHRRQTM